jgi:hypothetical protein
LGGGRGEGQKEEKIVHAAAQAARSSLSELEMRTQMEGSVRLPACKPTGAWLARMSLSSVSQAIEIAAKWLCALCSAESIMVNDSLSLNSRSVLWKLLQARRIFFEFILAGHLWRRLIRFS